ncbi:hypothetical protein [Malikia spinosa]|uniref:Uncharacterized protein n=1 Tax=Malikia spinosa TaxID=86180 RepID=A0A7C9J8J0_9BURK|nr:hypothetical protein [Malikia spinosa]MYZ52450.1 hypothetical protein [Malikia spinosa]
MFFTNTNEVYITKQNFNKILPLNEKIIIPDDKTLDTIYKNSLRGILSTPEVGLLYILKEFYSNKEFALERYQKIRFEDNKKFVYVSRNPSYHYDINCKNLSSDFVNFEIPEEIKARGDHEIYLFREFYKKNSHLLKEKNDIFIMRLKIEFKLENPPSRVEFDNSGRQEINNIDLNELEKQIDELIINAEKYRNTDKETKEIIEKYGYGTHKRKETQTKGSPLYEWHHTYKSGIKELIKEYFRVKFNPNLSFEGKLLDELGFKPCAHCSRLADEESFLNI